MLVQACCRLTDLSSGDLSAPDAPLYWAVLGCTGLYWAVPARKHNAHLSDTLSSQTAGGEISAWQVTNYGEHTGAEATIGKELLYIILSAKLIIKQWILGGGTARQ